MRPVNNIKKSIRKLKVESGEQINNRILDKLMRTLDKSKQMKTAEQANIWKIIMKSQMSKITAALLIIVLLIMCVHFLGSTESVAWADVVRPILTARTVVFTVTMDGGENVPTKVMNMGAQRVRNEVLSPDGKGVK